jgi:hypothetical protein
MSTIMNRWIVMGMIGAMCGCAAPRSSFDFGLKGDVEDSIHSGARVSGAANNAGFLALNDPDTGWSIAMSLGGLAPGDHVVGNKSGYAVFTHKSGMRGVFTTALGGTCTVTVDPHYTSNGDTVHANFFCTGLAAADGRHINVPQGEFRTFINDEANNLDISPPAP